MLKEHDRAVLTRDLTEEGLQAGDVGVVVHVHKNRKAFELEFFALDGTTLAVATVDAAGVRPVTPQDVSHTRVTASPA